MLQKRLLRTPVIFGKNGYRRKVTQQELGGLSIVS